MVLLLHFLHSYTKTVKEFSTVYRDRPLGPMKTAIYWVEYVIRHRGAPHMRSPATKLNLLQRNSVDVLLFLALVVYLFVLAVKYLFQGFSKVVKMAFARIGQKEKDKTAVAVKVKKVN